MGIFGERQNPAAGAPQQSTARNFLLQVSIVKENVSNHEPMAAEEVAITEFACSVIFPAKVSVQQRGPSPASRRKGNLGVLTILLRDDDGRFNEKCMGV